MCASRFYLRKLPLNEWDPLYRLCTYYFVSISCIIYMLLSNLLSVPSELIISLFLDVYEEEKRKYSRNLEMTLIKRQTIYTMYIELGKLLYSMVTYYYIVDANT